MRSYRASSLGSCLRAQIALQLGMSAIGTSDKMQALYDRGNDHEVECLAAMEADGWQIREPDPSVVFMGATSPITVDEDQWAIALPVAGAAITGHLDGLVTREAPFHIDRASVLEIKSPHSWHSWERAHKTGDYSDPLMHRYAWQISVYMVATGLEAVVACVEDGQVRTFGIEVPPFDVDAIERRIIGMEINVKDGTVPSVCSQSDFPCPVAYLHDKREVVEDPVLTELLLAYQRAKEARDMEDGFMKGLRRRIGDHLGLSDTLTTEAGTATRVPDSLVTDWKATAEELAERTGALLNPVQKRRAGFVKVTPREVDGDQPGA